MPVNFVDLSLLTLNKSPFTPFPQRRKFFLFKIFQTPLHVGKGTEQSNTQSLESTAKGFVSSPAASTMPKAHGKTHVTIITERRSQSPEGTCREGNSWPG